MNFKSARHYRIRGPFCVLLAASIASALVNACSLNPFGEDPGFGTRGSQDSQDPTIGLGGSAAAPPAASQAASVQSTTVPSQTPTIASPADAEVDAGDAAPSFGADAGVSLGDD